MLRIVLAALAFALAPSLASADPLEMAVDDNGVSAAPIHGDAVDLRLTTKGGWNDERPEPKVRGRSLWIHWEGRAKTPRGHPLAVLYVKVRLAIPAGAGLSSRLSHPVTPIHSPTENLDFVDFELPLPKLAGNHADFFLRLIDSKPVEFSIDYELHLPETVAGIHPNCGKWGVTLKELASAGDRRPGFLFASCIREDRLVYVNILKPLELKFTGEGRDVIKIPMRPARAPRHETVGELALTDGRANSSRYELSFDSDGPKGLWLALGLAPAYYSYNDNGFKGPGELHQLSLMALLSTGYLFAPGNWEVGLEGKGSLATLMLSDNAKPAATFLNLGYHFGHLFQVGGGEHVFGLHLGWYHTSMLVKDAGYGMQQQQAQVLAGPQLTLDVRYSPLGRLGWTGYFKFTPIAESLDALDFGKLQRHDITFGASIDLPWEESRLRRPSVFIEAGFLAYSLQSVDSSENHVMLGLLWPIF